MNKRRLLKLADLLEADAKKKNGVKFDLRTVVMPSKSLSKDSKVVLVSCGTQACAMGLAAISGEFKRDGLSYRIDPDGFMERISIRITMHGRETQFGDAAEKLFGLSYHEADFLFLPNFYPSRAPKTGVKGELLVAKRIRDFVAGKVAP